MLQIIDTHILADKSRVQTEETTAITYGDLIIEYLSQLKIEVIFGVPGGAIEPFLNALARSERRGGPRLVVARHECGAAFMADGYSRETGKMGVVCSTTGPGATNLITGIASALADEIPLLVITAQTSLPKFGKRALQESSCTAIDTVGMLRYVTRFNTLVSHTEQLEGKLVSAIMAVHQMPQGPAHISIPSDILNAPPQTTSNPNTELMKQEFSVVDEVAVTRLIEKLNDVSNFVVYVGNGVGKASPQIMEFIELTNSLFITGPTGKSRVNELHPLYRGVYGFAGHESAKAALLDPNLDLIIAIGTALDELDTSGWSADLLNNKLIHIDSSIEHFTRSPMAQLHIFGSIDKVFELLLVNLREKGKPAKKWNNVSYSATKNVNGGYATLNEPSKCFSNEVPIKPQRLMSQLSRSLPENTRIHIDAGNSWSWATHYLARSNSEGLYRIAMGYGSMTWSIGAAIGSALGNPSAPTLCIVGDGSYLMSAQEITVAAQHKLPVVFLVLNDSAMGMVMHGQKLGNQESIGWELNQNNFAAMARSMGVAGVVIQTPEQLELLDWSTLFACNGPTLIDVRIDRNEVPPMTDRIKGLAVKYSATPGG